MVTTPFIKGPDDVGPSLILPNEHDGMPDQWELGPGPVPSDPDDQNHVANGGYNMLEKYLNNLASQF